MEKGFSTLVSSLCAIFPNKLVFSSLNLFPFSLKLLVVVYHY